MKIKLLIASFNCPRILGEYLWRALYNVYLCIRYLSVKGSFKNTCFYKCISFVYFRVWQSKAQSGLTPVFTTEASVEHRYIHLCIVHSCLHTLMTELNSCVRKHMAYKP